MVRYRIVKNLLFKTVNISGGMCIAYALVISLYQPSAAETAVYSGQGNADLRLDDDLIRKLEEKMSASLIEWYSSPFSIVGESRMKIQYHSFSESPPFMHDDESWIQSGWEANEGLVRLAMGINLGRYGSVVAKVGFQHTLPGNHLNMNSGADPDEPGFEPARSRHDRSDVPIYLHEDMMAAVQLFRKPAALSLRLGGVQWMELSPLTVWTYQPRLFAWDYLPVEINESVEAFYFKNMISGERTGRVAWNKRPFNGIGFTAAQLPPNLNVDLFYGSFYHYDCHEREYTDLQGDLAYYSLQSSVKGAGLGDTYRHVVLGRVQESLKGRRSGDFRIGINVVRLMYDEDVAVNKNFRMIFGGQSPDSAFYKEPWVFSSDFTGNLLPELRLHAEVALSRVDTTFIEYQGKSLDTITFRCRSGPPVPALFARIDNKYVLPVRIDLFCAFPGFYSPFSNAPSIDGFYPWGANLVGPGQYVTAEYTQNMAGLNCSVAPWNLRKNGHFKVNYGNHMQLHTGPDVIYFPYRLNGTDLFSLFQTSYSRWGLNLLDFSMNGTYEKRLGDESYQRRTSENPLPLGPEAGGMRSNFMAMYESFIPYDSGDAVANLHDKTSVFKRSEHIPSHRKYTVNSELDGSYNIGTLLGIKRNLFVAFYGALNSITTAPSVFPARRDMKNSILWGSLVRLECAQELPGRLWLIELGGFENWYAEKAWMSADGQSVRRQPIDFRDFAVGAGFDWQVFDQAGIHFRCKEMMHFDKYYAENNWKTPIVSVELKMWF